MRTLFADAFYLSQLQWTAHFIWSTDALRILGRTAIGRATCDRFDLNDERHDDQAIQNARQIWTQSGWHPPDTDPRQASD